MALGNDCIPSNIDCLRLISQWQLPLMEIPCFPTSLMGRNVNSNPNLERACCCVATRDSMVLIGVFVRLVKPCINSEKRLESLCLNNCSIVFFQ